jgi:ornithine decarboxylase
MSATVSTPIPGPAASEPSSIETPYFVLDPDELRAQVTAFEAAFPGAEINYAVKANGTPEVLTVLANTSCGFEVASWYEVERLLSLGIDSRRIIYGTAVKPTWHVERAATAGVDRFAADSSEELTMLSKSAPGSRVYIRAAVDDSGSVFQMSGKFGAPLEHVEELVRQAASVGLEPYGLSINVGSQSLSPSSWSNGITELRPVFEALSADELQVATLNLGGGFPVSYVNHQAVPTLDTIARLVNDAVECLPYRPKLLLEPGRALVASSMTFVASVVARVERPDGPWLFLDGGTYNGLVEALGSQGSTDYPVLLDGSPHRSDVDEQFVLAGPTGDNLDIVTSAARLPGDTSVGDRLVFANAGAYTLSMTSRFNGFPEPTVHLLEAQRADEGTGATSIDTIESRLSIGFPDSPADWCAAPARIDSHELRILDHPVMRDWEQDYMAALADVVTDAGGEILELGYGLGISAKAVQAHERVTKHVVVECHPDVVAACLRDCRSAIASQRLHCLSASGRRSRLD